MPPAEGEFRSAPLLGGAQLSRDYATKLVSLRQLPGRSCLNPSNLRADLRRLASNHRWTWDTESAQLLGTLPGSGPGMHPVSVVDAMTDDQIGALAADEQFCKGLAHQLELLDALAASAPPIVAYCSPEFGISALVPQYSGGLGVLAGDHLKAASDLATPLIGVGLMYSNSVFHQVIQEGHQVETHRRIEPAGIGAEDTGVEVHVPFPGRDVYVQVWSMWVGATRLLLLSTDVERNSDDDRGITDYLYEGTSQHRLEQEMILGVGGARALRALGFEIKVHHLNEGHAGFLALELIDRVIENGDLDAAVNGARQGLVFTTHTPVPAGIDRFHRDVIGSYLDRWTTHWDISPDELWALGRDPEDDHRFNMAAFCLRLSGAANGVSRLHGEVSRDMFSGVGIGSEIQHITNGVHARTWTSPQVQDLLDDALGAEWAAGDHESWDRVDAISDDSLTSTRRIGALRLADLVNSSTGHKLDPDALIFGFARRFAPYKRATLLFRHMDRLEALLADNERPVHFVFAGKAHPADEPGKTLVAQVAAFAESSLARDRFTFLPDYDMDKAGVLVQGSDVWLNNPIRPREASGTSGEKVALNGGLNCSILDGWWAEMFDGKNGWGVPASPHQDPGERDLEESNNLLTVIDQIAEEYHHGRPIFLGRIRHAWRTLGPQVTAARMVRDYEDRIYRPALDRTSS